MRPTFASHYLAGARLAALAAVLAGCATGSVGPGTTAASGPCDGRDPAAEAAATQGMPPYVGKDSYRNVVLREGTVLYSLTPGAPPGFAVADATLRDAAGSWRKYYALVQVTTDPGKDAQGGPRKLREAVRAFHLSEPLCVAHGIARANPQFGAGGGIQYYVSPGDAGKLRPGTITPIAGWRPADHDDDEQRASVDRP